MRSNLKRFSQIRIALLVCALLAAFVAVNGQALATSYKGTPPRLEPGTILGVADNGQPPSSTLPWVRLGYVTCFSGSPSGALLKTTIQNYHTLGIRVLLTVCQPQKSQLFNTTLYTDAAQGDADAVECGNEQMKYAPGYTSYVPPRDFARVFDLCQNAVHTVNPTTPIILGSLDPHVANNADYWKLQGQVRYLDEMQSAMNTQIHRGGTWSWRSQILGLINSWHDGYPGAYVNNLFGLFSFWARQFHIPLANLGQHIWVVEGTGCFQGCGINAANPAQVAIAHVVALITDVQTATRFHIPFFFFSGKDFKLRGTYWPIGITDLKGKPKPLRQDLPMGSRSLTMKCSSGQITVFDQEKLLASLYQRCSLPQAWFMLLT